MLQLIDSINYRIIRFIILLSKRFCFFFFQFLVCLLNAVGIPVLHAESQYSAVGSWMRDHRPSNQEMAERRWVTDDYASPVLYEYENERQLMNKKQKIKYHFNRQN